ncbi:MAG: hypothetical protein A2511_17015 [Deltaproteobacteria bacterium RIFOXYD12_FULL_50_9]|nr:MAG: hypothetical protein A2511_17015 [Deltaproteobacteria bacterium RIFOXYD12_FULL_50_9]
MVENKTYIQILRLSGVLERTGLKRATIYAFIAARKFPAAIPLDGILRRSRNGYNPVKRQGGEP